MHTYRVGDDVTVLNDHLEVPGLGFLPVNAFVLHAREPVVVDTGLSLPDRDFMGALRSGDDPVDLAHAPGPRSHRRPLRALGRRPERAPRDHVPRRGYHVHRTRAAARSPVHAESRTAPRGGGPNLARVPATTL